MNNELFELYLNIIKTSTEDDYDLTVLGSFSTSIVISMYSFVDFPCSISFRKDETEIFSIHCYKTEFSLSYHPERAYKYNDILIPNSSEEYFQYSTHMSEFEIRAFILLDSIIKYGLYITLTDIQMVP